MITASIIADSINPSGNRLTTFLLTYPRFIHSELLTHRCFSRNAASSRAIPIEKMIDATYNDPAWPEQWGSNKPGMQAGEPLCLEAQQWCNKRLQELGSQAVEAVRDVSTTGLHKQVANRYLEPWAHITVIATASDWGLSNFFALRASPMAQPELQVLAYRMLDLYLRTGAHEVAWGGWHIPFAEGVYDVHDKERMEPIIKASVGRCARVSYLRQDDDNPAKNIELHDRLAASGHWSPFEHVAQAVEKQRYVSNFDNVDLSGWEQYRKTFTNENQTQADLPALLTAKPDWVTI